MSLELIYTSAPKGLKAGSSGFCTVALTGGMSRVVSTKLEMLSGYEFPFKISDPNAKLSPANFAHTAISMGGGTKSILSRIGFSGSDYSGRANKIAHHFMLSQTEQLQVGPAAMLMQMRQKGLFQADWQDAPQERPEKHLDQIADAIQDNGSNGADTWKKMTGDAGWAGMLARAFVQNKKVPAYVIFKPGQDVLPLFAESMACLPQNLRWKVGFATYYTVLPAGCNYHWRGILAGSASQKEIARFPNATVIDLTRPIPAAEDNPYTMAAREGTLVELQKPSPSRPTASKPQQNQLKQNPPESDDVLEIVDEEPIQEPIWVDEPPTQEWNASGEDITAYLRRKESKNKKLFIVIGILTVLLLLMTAWVLYPFLRSDKQTVIPKEPGAKSPNQSADKEGSDDHSATDSGSGSKDTEDPSPGSDKQTVAPKESEAKDPNEPAETQLKDENPNNSAAEKGIPEGQSTKDSGSDSEDTEIPSLRGDKETAESNEFPVENKERPSELNTISQDKEESAAKDDRPPKHSLEPINREEIKSYNPDSIPGSGREEILFPLEKIIRTRGSLYFPEDITDRGIDSKFENGKRIIKFSKASKAVRITVEQTLATCVIEEGTLRYSIDEGVRDEKRKMQEARKYYPIAKNLVIELIDENGIVYRCPITTKDADEKPISVSIREILEKVEGSNISTETLKDYLRKYIDEKYTSKYPKELPLYVNEDPNYLALVETLDFEKEITELMPQIIQKNKIDKLEREREQNKDPKNKKRIAKINEEIKAINKELQPFNEDISKIIKEINERIDGLDPKKYTDEKIDQIKGHNLKPKLVELRGNYDFMIYLKDAWDFNVFKVNVKYNQDEDKPDDGWINK